MSPYFFYISIISAIGLIYYVLATPSKDRFSITKKFGLVQPAVQPGSGPGETINLSIQGYNYQDTPIIYRDHIEIVPLRFSMDYTNMIYYFIVSAPKGIEGSTWNVRLSDAVEPVVFIEGKKIGVAVDSKDRRVYKLLV